MTFGEKLRRARREKGLTQAELANQAGLGLRTIIAYEKGETYPQKRSTYQTLADILGVQADDLHNEETAIPAAPLSRTQWENSKRRYEELLPDGPAWPGDSSYEEYCKKMAQSSHADTARNSYKSTGSELPQITIRPALAKDFPTLLQICKDRCQFDATRAGVDKSKRSQLPTFESQLETLTQSLVTWIAAGQCFLMEANGRPGAWFVLQLPAPDDYPSASKRKGGAKATASTPLPRATMWGPYTSPPFCGCFQIHARLLPSLLPAAGHRGPAGRPAQPVPSGLLAGPGVCAGGTGGVRWGGAACYAQIRYSNFLRDNISLTIL